MQFECTVGIYLIYFVHWKSNPVADAQWQEFALRIPPWLYDVGKCLTFPKPCLRTPGAPNCRGGVCFLSKPLTFHFLGLEKNCWFPMCFPEGSGARLKRTEQFLALTKGSSSPRSVVGSPGYSWACPRHLGDFRQDANSLASTWSLTGDHEVISS